MLGSVSDADEVVHDVCLALSPAPQQLRLESTVTTYLYGAVTHACLNRIRNRRTRERLLSVHGAQPSEPSASGEWIVAARHLLAQLPEELAELAVYRYVDELSQREIARVIGCSHTQVGRLTDRLTDWLSAREKHACR
jgi:RNA polymerase sigma factor (sigma-70 family)